MQLAQLIRDRRQNMGMSLQNLSSEMGGSPGASFISRIESGEVEPSSTVAVRLAEALALPREIALNASGFATPIQAEAALARLADIIGSPAPVMANLPVLDPADPDAPVNLLPHRKRLLRRQEDAFLVDLSGAENEPFVGEVMASRARRAKADQHVVAVAGGKVGAWTLRTSRPTGDYLERANGERIAAGYRILGVIIRVVTELDLDGEE
jgi:transcriptional regulator with XRE-family HTH domain